MVEFRKIQKTGGSTYIVSLPKGWVEKRLKAGDTVSLLEKGDFVIVSSRTEGQEKTVSCSVEYKDDLDSLVRRFIAHYLNGCNTLRVYTTSQGLSERVEIKKTLCDRLPGMEVVEESPNDITFRNLLKYAEFPFRSTLRRMHFLVCEMQKTLLESMGRLVDDRAVGEIKGLEREVDKFFILGVRQLIDSSSNPMLMEALGLESERQCIEYMLIVKGLEKIADHVEIAADIIHKERLAETAKSYLLKIGNACFSVYNMAFDALFRGDVALAEKAIVKSEELAEGSMKPARQTDFLLYNFIRIAEYAADVSEIVIDMSVKAGDMPLRA